ncbi:hypothetical protein SY88_22735 [Clostridiales bacterium PH28_bin88]|nr:hypothetical protein SY88_22735 [Clostridiales bacterium PH28_bin88]
MPFCSECGAELAAPDAQFCSQCGAKTDLDAGAGVATAAAYTGERLNPVTAEPASRPGFKPAQRFGGDQEFANYVMEAEGTNAKTINICMAVGIFILGWLAIMVYSFLGKPYKGLLYFVPVFIFARFAVGSIPLFILVVAIWAIAWVDANRTLGKYQAAAKRRLNEINLQPAPGVDLLLEKGILLQKVLGRGSEALESIKQAIAMPGGDPVLWGLAGVAMFKLGAFAEANAAFNRSNGAQGGRAYQNRLRAHRKKVGKKLGIASSH